MDFFFAVYMYNNMDVGMFTEIQYYVYVCIKWVAENLLHFDFVAFTITQLYCFICIVREIARRYCVGRLVTTLKFA